MHSGFIFVCFEGSEKQKGRITAPIDDDSRRASSRGLIPKAKIKTIKMTLVIVLGK